MESSGSASKPLASPVSATERMGLDRRVLQWLRAWVAREDVRQPLSVFVLTRGLFVVLTYFGVILFNSVLHGPHPSFLHQLLPAWDNRWDTAWYIEIAQRGYNWKKAVGTSPTAFFPLYPLLIRAGVDAVHKSYIVVALGISNLCFLAALLYLWRLTRWELGSNIAGRTILYISVFPTALFFFAGYTESLFLFLTVASFYHLRRGDWLAAGAFGACASATRVIGVLLVLPFAYEYLRSRNFSLLRIEKGIIGLILIPLGLLAFMLYLHLTVGDTFAFTHYQAAWQKIFTLRLWAGILESLRQIFGTQPPASFYQAHNVINVTIGALFLVSSALLARRMPAAYGAYVAAFWLVTLTSPAMAGGYPVPLISMSRYVLALFPVFMYMGIRGRASAFHNAYLVVSTSMLALLTIQFINGGWVV